MQQPGGDFRAFRARVDAAPDRADAKSPRGQQEIFHGRRAVEGPVAKARVLLQGQLRRHHDGRRRGLAHGRVGMDVRDGSQNGPVGHHHEMPGLGVAGARRGHGRPQQGVEVRLGHGGVGVGPDAAPGMDGVEKVHVASFVVSPLRFG